MLDATTLRTLLDYEPESGKFTWRVNRGRMAKAGAPAGCVQGVGYVQVTLCGRYYYAHRLAWLYVHGDWPPEQIDHINGDRTDNRISNIRLATRQQNSGNTKRSANNTSGIKGVCWNRNAGKWQANVKVDGRKRHLGLFTTKAEAAAAYHAAAAAHFGEFVKTG